MRKIFIILASLVALVVAGPAVAAKVKSGTSTITLSDTAAKALSDNGITATANDPATSSGNAFTFPVARGHVNKNGRGWVLHRGSVTLAKGDKKFVLRRPLVVVTKKRAVLAVQTRQHCRRHGRHLVCRAAFRPVAKLTDLKRDGNTATATLTLTKFAANKLNKLAGTSFVKAGDAIGTGTITVATK